MMSFLTGSYKGIENYLTIDPAYNTATFDNCTLTTTGNDGRWDPNYNLERHQQERDDIAKAIAERGLPTVSRGDAERFLKEAVVDEIERRYPNLKVNKSPNMHNCEFHDLLDKFERLVKQF